MAWRVDLFSHLLKLFADGWGEGDPVPEVVLKLYPPEYVTPQLVELWIVSDLVGF